MTSPLVRCFLAIELDSAVRAEVVRLEEQTTAAVPAAQEALSWVAEPNVHLTLVFLGLVNPAQLERLSAGLTPIASAARPFELGTTVPGVFGAVDRPKVFWLGIGDPGGSLRALQSPIAAMCTGLGLGADDHAYHPHLTAGRPRANVKRPVLAQVAAAWMAQPSTSQRHAVTGFSLMQSKMQAGSPRYARLAHFPLAPT